MRIKLKLTQSSNKMMIYKYNFEISDIYEYNLYNFEIMKMTHNIDIIILENLEYKKYIKIIILIIKKLL